MIDSIMFHLNEYVKRNKTVFIFIHLKAFRYTESANLIRLQSKLNVATLSIEYASFDRLNRHESYSIQVFKEKLIDAIKVPVNEVKQLAFSLPTEDNCELWSV